MAKKKRRVAGIDVGTTKICCCIAEITESAIHVVGTGWSDSKGLKKGVVVNLSETIRSVKRSLEKAEAEAQSVVESAYVSVGGGYLRSTNRRGETDVRGKNGKVSSEDIGRAVETAKTFDLPGDYEIIHVLTQSFALDGQMGVVNPLGMSGQKLGVQLHVVFNASAVVQNIVNAINRAGVVVSGVVMQQLASSEAVLTEDEKELGTVLVDIGGGTTDISIYNQGSVWHSEVLPMGGSLITKDIAIGLKAPLHDAEVIKRKVGNVFPFDVPEEEVIEIGEMGTGRQRTISRRLLCQIVEARADEILQSVKDVLESTGVEPDLTSGVVLTGGGSLLQGMVHRAEQVLGIPVRLGCPIDFETKNEQIYHPAYSTALGLLKYAKDISAEEMNGSGASLSLSLSRPRATTERLKKWIFERI